MEAAGDLVENIKSHSRDGSFTPTERAEATKHNAQAVLSLVQTAVTIHAASKQAKNGRSR